MERTWSRCRKAMRWGFISNVQQGRSEGLLTLHTMIRVCDAAANVGHKIYYFFWFCTMLSFLTESSKKKKILPIASVLPARIFFSFVVFHVSFVSYVNHCFREGFSSFGKKILFLPFFSSFFFILFYPSPSVLLTALLAFRTSGINPEFLSRYKSVSPSYVKEGKRTM